MSEMALAGEIPSSRRLDEEEDVSVGETDQLYGHLYQWPRRNKEDVDAIAFVLFFLSGKCFLHISIQLLQV